MKVAILTRPGACFPNIISQGLSKMLTEIGIENRIFDSAIPFLMRLLPFSEKPKRWVNNFHYRLYNKLSNRRHDAQLLKDLAKFDVVILSECLPNAFWKNYLAVETLRQRLNKPILSYTDAYINNAPLHQKMWFDGEDWGANRYNVNLCPSVVTEIRSDSNANWKAIGVNIALSGLKPIPRKEFVAVVDFPQKGYELYREQQLAVLKNLGIKTIQLNGRYPIEEIRAIYQQAAIFFLAFPETFGLPIAECLACGTYVFTPNSGWPMAWRLDKKPMPWAPGTLPGCFKTYNSEEDLTNQLSHLVNQYDPEKTPFEVFDLFIKNYPHLYYGDRESLKAVLTNIKL